MKKTLQLVAALSLSSLAGHAQTVPPARRPDTTTAVARHRAEHYTGPKVVENTQALGQKFRKHSRPANVPLRMRPQPNP